MKKQKTEATEPSEPAPENPAEQKPPKPREIGGPPRVPSRRATAIGKSAAASIS